MFAHQKPSFALPFRPTGSMLTCDTTVPHLPSTRQGGLTLYAPGRLHLGFLDPAGTLGRPFGSLGLVIDGFETVLELAVTAATHAENREAAEAYRRLLETANGS